MREAPGKKTRVKFDFPNPAIVKHLDTNCYAERLFENFGLFQRPTLGHIRPFSGHHCQISIVAAMSMGSAGIP